MVGVGDGPWDMMEKFDDDLRERRFDNFHFVDFQQMSQYPKEVRETAFATHALMEVPQQYRTIKKMGLLRTRDSEERCYPSVLAPPTNTHYKEMVRDLPGDWVCAWSPQWQRHYYLSWELRKTQWEKPANLAVHKEGKVMFPPIAVPSADKRACSRVSQHSTASTRAGTASATSSVTSLHSLESSASCSKQQRCKSTGRSAIAPTRESSTVTFAGDDHLSRQHSTSTMSTSKVTLPSSTHAGPLGF